MTQTYMADGEQRNALPFDLDLLFCHPSMKQLARDIKRAKSPRGVFRLIHGSIQLDGGGNGVAVATEQPGGGRIWFVRSFHAFDVQAPTVSNTITTTAAVTAVVLGASTVATQNLNTFPVLVTVAGGTVTVIVVNGITTNATSGTFLLEPGWTIALTYSVAPTTFTTAAQGTTNQTVSPAGTISLWAEPTPPLLTPGFGFQPNPPNPNGIIVPQALGLPVSMTFTNWVYKLWNQENLYAVFRNVTGTTSGSVAFVSRVSEYYIEDVEMMHT